MLKEDCDSQQMNLEGVLAEMEYHEEVIDQYRYEHSTESQVLL